MTARETNFQQVLDLARELIQRSGQHRAMAAADRVFRRLSAAEGETVSLGAERLPVCHHHVEAAFAGLSALPSPLPELASALAAVEARLRWSRRKGSDAVSQQFHDGHANATLIGPGGLEQRDDVLVGMSVMAPGITYPDHSHPPEEVYLALTGGAWWNAAMDWTEPGPGGVIYNPPGILHAMRSGEGSFLALWFLPID